MLEMSKRTTGNNKALNALLNDLPKVFDCLSHNLLIAKLDAFRLNINSLNILQGYLGNRNQRTKVAFYSFWEAIRSGVPQC